MKSYQQFILKVLPRILSNLDRDPESPTYGCFDRHYWLYHLTDFPNAILQQNCLTLALVYLNNFEGNLYFQNSNIKNWAMAAVNYWQKLQHGDGSFDEYWKNEGGVPPTVFSTYAVSETLRLLAYQDKAILEKLKKACEFLANNPESFASNQEVAATAVIYSVYLNTNDQNIYQLYLKKLNNLKKLQSAEGFFYEQNGADAGYLSVSINYLAWLYQLTKNQTIKVMVDKAVIFLSYFIHPDGSLGGEYGSRNTEYLLPAGLNIFAQDNPLALAIILKTEEYFKGYDNFSIGDHYLLHYLGPSYALATTSEELSLPKVALPYQRSFIKHFPDAGLLIISREDLYFIINIKKGGVCKLFAQGKLLVNDLGYRLRKKNGQMYFSEYGQENPEFKLKTDPEAMGINPWCGVHLEINKLFSSKKYLQITPLKKFLLYLFSTLWGRNFRKFVKRQALVKAKPAKYLLTRKIVVAAQSVKIIDQISPQLQTEQLIRAVSQSIKIIPSAKFFQITELSNQLPHQIIKQPPDQIITTIDLINQKVSVNY